MTEWARRHRDIWMPIAAGASLRFGLMFAAFALTGTRVMTQGDTVSYLEPGRSLILHGVFANNGVPEIDRTPGYPIFLMLSGMFSGNVLLAVSVQIVLSMLTLFLISRIAAMVFADRRAGVAAAWLYALEPASILYAVRLMPETFFVLLIVITIERLLTFQVTGRLQCLSLAAVSLAAATYVRPVSYYLALPVACGLAWVTPKNTQFWWKAPGILLAIMLPLLAAWQLRNAVETGYGGFSSIVEKNLYFFQSAEVTAELRHTSLEAEQRQRGYSDESDYLQAHPEQRSWSRSQRLQFMRAEAVGTLSHNRWLYLQSHMRGVAVVAFAPCATELLQLLNAYPADGPMPRRIVNEGILVSAIRVLQTHPAVALLMALMEGALLLFYLLAIRGSFSATGNRPAIFALAGVAIYFLLVSGGAQAVGRYRLPVMPELCILAGGGYMAFRKQRKGGARSLRPASIAL